MISLDEHESVDKKYQAWVNNKIQVLTLTIQRNQARDIRILLKHEFFLEEIEHHFMDCHAGHRVWRGFLHLKRYLRNCPHAKTTHRRGALKMLGLIYGELGFDERKIL